MALADRVIRPLIRATFAIPVLLAAAPAAAEPFPTVPVPAPAFAAPAVADADLSRVRGGFPGRGYVASMADVQARDDLRWSASLGTLAFDNWFNDVGNPLIFAAQR